MTEERTGLEWFFGLEGLSRRFDGLMGVSEEQLDAIVEAFQNSENGGREELRKILWVDDSLLTATTDEDRQLERRWMEQQRLQGRKVVCDLIEKLSSLPIDDDLRRSIAATVVDLVDIGIKAGPYQPWLERSQALKVSGARHQVKVEQAAIGTSAARNKADRKTEIVRELLASAPKSKAGRLLRGANLLSAVNERLPANQRWKDLRSLRRHIQKIKSRT